MTTEGRNGIAPRESLSEFRPGKYTRRARIGLVLLPIIVPISVLWLVCLALFEAVKAFGSEFRDCAEYSLHEWYSHVYRPARYGSVWDDVDETGWPKAWGPRRGHDVRA